ncbi:MAG: TetR/AcrR family transcriptional regulator [Alphaproteobacteria bacterium]|nr:TetR/AcrR family transcriptional regulator [Alphaproteobacteria bacterium]
MNMSSHKKRTYHSETRKAQAIQTRSRVLAAAKSLFHSKGFEGVTIEQIAQAADVSAPTIYGLFQSKRGVLRALMDEALPADQFEAHVKEAMQEKSPEKHLALSAKIARRMYDAERAQMEIFQGAAILSPEFKELEKERELRRYKRQEESIKMIAKAGALLKELNVSKARDILWAFTGRDMYRMFVIEQGWTSDEYETWLVQVLVKTLIRIEE